MAGNKIIDDEDDDEGLPAGVWDDHAASKSITEAQNDSAWKDSLTAKGLVKHPGDGDSNRSLPLQPKSGWYEGNGGYSGKGYSGSYSGGYVSKTCEHNGEKTVIDMDGIRLHGAKKSQLTDKRLFDPKGMVLNCTGSRISESVVMTVRGPWNFSEHVDVEPCNEVVIDWRDMQPPPLKPSFWKAVWAVAEKEGLTDITACCLGSHGRTGTALSCLLVAKGWQAGEAINYVRQNHCKDAVETEGQRRYIERVAAELNGEEFAPEAPIAVPVEVITPKDAPIVPKGSSRAKPKGSARRGATPTKRPKGMSKRAWKKLQKMKGRKR